MKTDRILEIIIYLMNHDNVSARYLAEKFHVSVRTIQRDMISISAIGVPIYSENGKKGGYSILPTYKIKNINIRSDEQLMKESEQAYYKTSIPIEVQFANEETVLMQEYFPDCPIEQISENRKRMFIDVPAKERLWKALLLSLGDRVKVIGPEEYKRELIQTAQNFLSNYDTQLSR